VSVFRRFFVASEMIKEIMTQGGLRQPTFSGEATPSSSNFDSNTNDESVPSYLGGGTAPITGTRPTRTVSKTNTKQRESSQATRYKFPS